MGTMRGAKTVTARSLSEAQASTNTGSGWAGSWTGGWQRKELKHIERVLQGLCFNASRGLAQRPATSTGGTAVRKKAAKAATMTAPSPKRSLRSEG